MTISLAIDLILLVLLLLFVIRGVRRGAILTLCSLLAVFVAIFGGWFLAQHYAAPLEEKLEPILLERMLDKAEQESGQDASLPQIMRERVDDLKDSVIAEQSARLAQAAAQGILFLAGFAAVLILWLILCRVLNLVAKLPVLNLLNRLLGGVLGLAKGLLFLLVLRWVLGDLLGWIPEQITAESYVLSWLSAIPVLSILRF